VTIADWIAGRDPAAPRALLERLHALLPEQPGVGTAPDDAVQPEVLIRTATDVVARLLRERATTRDSALDLLVADALATYAFEAQADDPDALDARCAWAMRHLSAIADGP
jgi:hypothetical protein